MPANKLRKTAWDRFYKDGKKIKKDSSAKPWTLLLGSGMHKAIFADRQNTPRQEQALAVLGSWEGFLREVFHATETYAHFKDGPSLQWEMYAIKGESQRLKNKMAHEKEGQLHKTVQSMLADAQKILYSDAIHSKGYESISQLITSSEISDIVSLNLDLGVEEILKGLNFKKNKHRVNCSPESNAKIVRHTHFTYPSNGEDEIKKCIWYPHGNVENLKSMVFGVRQYALGLDLVESMRRRFKAGESRNEKNLTQVSWAGLFFDRPLLIAGASLSHSEWDIWFALTSRWRNYSKDKNKRHQPPVYFLTTPQHHKTLVDMPEFNFWRLEAPDYPTGWKWLSEAFSSPIEKMGK